LGLISNTGTLIKALVTPAYNDLDKPGLQKIMTQLRLALLGTVSPIIRVTPLVNYALQQETFSPIISGIEQSRWDEALWDVGRWAGGSRPLYLWIGVAANGFTVAPQIEIDGYGGLVFTQYDWLYTTGGPLG